MYGFWILREHLYLVMLAVSCAFFWAAMLPPGRRWAVLLSPVLLLLAFLLLYFAGSRTADQRFEAHRKAGFRCLPVARVGLVPEADRPPAIADLTSALAERGPDPAGRYRLLRQTDSLLVLIKPKPQGPPVPVLVPLLALLTAALLLAVACTPEPAPTADRIIEQVAEWLRERDGAEPQPAEVIDELNAIAARRYHDGKYRETTELAALVLAQAESLLGDEHPKTLIARNNLAFLYVAQGRYDEAEPLYQRALAARERVQGKDHPDTLVAVNNLASLFQAQGRHGEAEPLFRRALAVSERVLGEGHPQTLTSLNNLAGLFQAQGRYDEAEPLLRRALEASEQVLGVFHPDTIGYQLNLTVLLVNQQNIDAALSQLRTLDQRMRTFVTQELASTEQEQVRLQRLAMESRLQDIVYTLALVHPDNADVRRLAADVLLRWKRLAADEEAVVARLARASPDPRVAALAGASRGLEGKLGADGEDGILYALEAQDLYLEGTELVALSVCDTGRGRVDASEGVYGLVRAFQIAGARYVLMTQWSLNDALARKFMVDFYRRWLSPETADDPVAALRAIQLDWLRGGEPAKADPRYWAPYVLIERR